MSVEQERPRSRRTMRSRPRPWAKTDQRRCKGEATRGRILDAAMLIVAQEGYHAATHQRIARAAGLVRTAINYHFPDRDQLSEALILHLRRLRAERVAAMVGAPEHSHGSAIEAYWALLRETPFVATAELECCARTDPDLRARLAAVRCSSALDGDQTPAVGPNLDRLSMYLLEGLARGGGHEGEAFLERRGLGILKRAAEEARELESAARDGSLPEAAA
ncbi:helix-turn-helix domain-containing protein [Phenylobacterium sp.]|uniref:TetR/AcrR family transcriptional regulator n=1 Tax=Phenylobacterium sp. TaxID=1871053 RepID=UPI00286E05A8|nr:helix-turn-helix domain-containing protein [Phenylobacterium sp.]